jgi:hypothetical protein
VGKTFHDCGVGQMLASGKMIEINGALLPDIFDLLKRTAPILEI